MEKIQKKEKTIQQKTKDTNKGEVFQLVSTTPLMLKKFSENQIVFGGENTIQRKENNTGLPDNLKSGIESLSGHSMDDVKVHYNSSQPAQLNAHAFAQGSDIHLGSGQEKHLAHEAWHVVQQKQGRVQANRQMKGEVNINDNEGLEHEADVMGEKALQMKLNTSIQKQTILQKKDAPIQLRRESIPEQLILNVDVYDGDVLSTLIRTANGATSYASNVNWENKFMTAISSTISTKTFSPIVYNFTEYDGLNLDWEVSMRFYIDNRKSTGRTNTRTINTGSTGTNNSSLGHSNSVTDGFSISDDGIAIEQNSTTGSSHSVGSSVGHTLSQSSKERVSRYRATVFADISIKASPNSTTSDIVNPFKWGVHLGNALIDGYENRTETNIGSIIFDKPNF